MKDSFIVLVSNPDVFSFIEFQYIAINNLLIEKNDIYFK
jgi:hypothetical protein